MYKLSRNFSFGPCHLNHTSTSGTHTYRLAVILSPWQRLSTNTQVSETEDRRIQLAGKGGASAAESRQLSLEEKYETGPQKTAAGGK